MDVAGHLGIAAVRRADLHLHLPWLAIDQFVQRRAPRSRHRHKGFIPALLLRRIERGTEHRELLPQAFKHPLAHRALIASVIAAIVVATTTWTAAAPAEQASAGARALRAVCEELMLQIMYALPEQPQGMKYVFDEAVIMGKRSLFDVKVERRQSA